MVSGHQTAGVRTTSGMPSLAVPLRYTHLLKGHLIMCQTPILHSCILGHSAQCEILIFSNVNRSSLEGGLRF